MNRLVFVAASPHLGWWCWQEGLGLGWGGTSGGTWRMGTLLARAWRARGAHTLPRLWGKVNVALGPFLL